MEPVAFAVARKDYEDRRRRQGQAKAKAEGRYRGRKENVARNGGIASMLKGGVSWSQIQAATGCGRATIAKIAKRAGSELPEVSPASWGGETLVAPLLQLRDARLAFDQFFK